MHLRDLTLALLALLALAPSPAFCSAGPIDFHYTARGDATLYPGQWSPGDVTFFLDPAGDVQLPAAGGSVELGAVVFGPSPGPQAPWSYTASVGLTVAVVVTDHASGRPAELSLFGGAVDQWDYRAWDGLWRNSSHRLELGDPLGGNAAETSAVLGTNRYTLSVRPQNGDQEGVYTLTATVNNPEPATLALAALGLAPLAIRALRRAKAC